MNRRKFAESAMIGSASIFFGAEALAASDASSPREFVNARQLGATGDGRTDDTAALQRALDAAEKTSGAVFAPPGTYLSRELHMRPGTALIGIPAWNYSGPGGTVLRLASADSSCLLNLTDARGASIEGLALDGRNLGTGIHGIFVNRTEYPRHEDGFRIGHCQVAHFSGDGAHLACVWCFSIRHSMLAYNRGDGLNLRGWDGFILDNWFSGNERAGFAARHENASITFTGNRIEWNGEENMLVVGGDGYQITGNFFDRAANLRQMHCEKAAGHVRSAPWYREISSSAAASRRTTERRDFPATDFRLDGSGRASPASGTVSSRAATTAAAARCSPSLRQSSTSGASRTRVIRANVLHAGAQSLPGDCLDLGEQGAGDVVGDNPVQALEWSSGQSTPVAPSWRQYEGAQGDYLAGERVDAGKQFLMALIRDRGVKGFHVEGAVGHQLALAHLVEVSKPWRWMTSSSSSRVSDSRSMACRSSWPLRTRVADRPSTCPSEPAGAEQHADHQPVDGQQGKRADNAACHRVVVADDGVLHGVGEREQHHQVEGVELRQFALAETGAEHHQHQVDDDRTKQLLQDGKRQLKHVVEDERVWHGVEDKRLRAAFPA
jgi:hypothetical protein